MVLLKFWRRSLRRQGGRRIQIGEERLLRTPHRQSMRPGPQGPASSSGEAREETRPTSATPARQARARVPTSQQSPRSRAASLPRKAATLCVPCAHPTPPALPAHQCSEQVVVYKTLHPLQRAFPNPMRKNPCVLYPLASFLYRASLMMAMNRIANSDGSSRSGENES